MVDLPNANRKYFVQLAGVGLDAQVVKETSTRLRRAFGLLSYLISAAQIAARQPPKLVIERKTHRSTKARSSSSETVACMEDRSLFQTGGHRRRFVGCRRFQAARLPRDHQVSPGCGVQLGDQRTGNRILSDGAPACGKAPKKCRSKWMEN